MVKKNIYVIWSSQTSQSKHSEIQKRDGPFWELIIIFKLFY